jgi:Zn-dependent alcohol dehydrogenase
LATLQVTIEATGWARTTTPSNVSLKMIDGTMSGEIELAPFVTHTMSLDREFQE